MVYGKLSAIQAARESKATGFAMLSRHKQRYVEALSAPKLECRGQHSEMPYAVEAVSSFASREISIGSFRALFGHCTETLKTFDAKQISSQGR